MNGPAKTIWLLVLMALSSPAWGDGNGVFPGVGGFGGGGPFGGGGFGGGPFGGGFGGGPFGGGFGGGGFGGGFGGGGFGGGFGGGGFGFGGGGGGGVQAPQNENRKKADEITQAGQKAVEQVQKSAEQFGSSVDKLQSSFNSALPNLAHNDDNKDVLNSLSENLQKIQQDASQSIAQASVDDIIQQTAKQGETLVQTVKTMAQRFAPNQAPRVVPEQRSTVGDQISQYLAGRTALAQSNGVQQLPRIPNSGAAFNSARVPGAFGLKASQPSFTSGGGSTGVYRNPMVTGPSGRH